MIRLFAAVAIAVAAAAQASPRAWYAPPIGPAPGFRGVPMAASNGNVALLAWDDSVACSGVCAILLDANGQPLSERPFSLPTVGQPRVTTVASDGADFLVGITNMSFNVPQQLVPVSANGVVGRSRLLPYSISIYGAQRMVWDGSAYVIVVDRNNMSKFRFDRLGNPLGEPVMLSSESGTPDIAINAAGKLGLAWTNGSDTVSFLSEAAPNNVQRRKVAATSLHARIASDGQGFLVVDNRGTAQIYDDHGVPGAAAQLPDCCSVLGDAVWNGNAYEVIATAWEAQPSPALFTVGRDGSVTKTALTPAVAGFSVFDFDSTIVRLGGRSLAAWRVRQSGRADGEQIQQAIVAEIVGDAARILSNAPAEQSDVRAAWCGDGWLAAWVERGGAPRVRTGRIGPARELVDGTSVSPAGAAVDVAQTKPAVACNATTYAVAWSEAAAAEKSATVKLALFGRRNGLRDPRVVTLATNADGTNQVGLATDGERFLAAWRPDDGVWIAAARVTNDGARIDSVGVLLTQLFGSSLPNYDPLLLWDGRRYLLFWLHQRPTNYEITVLMARAFSTELIQDGETYTYGEVWRTRSSSRQHIDVVSTAGGGWFAHTFGNGNDTRLWLDGDLLPTDRIDSSARGAAAAVHGGKVFLILENAVLITDENGAVSTLKFGEQPVAFLNRPGVSPVIVLASPAGLTMLTLDDLRRRAVGAP